MTGVCTMLADNVLWWVISSFPGLERGNVVLIVSSCGLCVSHYVVERWDIFGALLSVVAVSVLICYLSVLAAWVPFFDDMNAIIFLAPISCFDQVLMEDNSVNRLVSPILFFVFFFGFDFSIWVTFLAFLIYCYQIYTIAIKTPVLVGDKLNLTMT